MHNEEQKGGRSKRRKKKRGPRNCTHCKQHGHTPANCPTKLCPYCEQSGHTLRQCPLKPKRPCPDCGKPGHPRSKCPDRTSECTSDDCHHMSMNPSSTLCRKCHDSKMGKGGGGARDPATSPKNLRSAKLLHGTAAASVVSVTVCTSYAFTTIDLLHYSSPIPTSPPPPPSHPPPHPSILKRVAGIFGSQGSRRTFLCSEGRRYHTPGLRTFPGTAYCGQRR